MAEISGLNSADRANDEAKVVRLDDYRDSVVNKPACPDLLVLSNGTVITDDQIDLMVIKFEKRLAQAILG